MRRQATRPFPRRKKFYLRVYRTGYQIREEDLTGVNMAALVYAASHILCLSEISTVVFEKKGGYNALFRLEFQDGRKLIARVVLKGSTGYSYIESSVATLTFARYVLKLPVPKVFAWNAGHDHAVRAPFIIQECVDNVIEPWKIWDTATDDERSHILDELARYHAILLAPLPHPLNGVGDLAFVPCLSTSSSFSDPKSYIVRPLRRPFLASSVSLPDVWEQLWSYQNDLRVCDSHSRINRKALGLEDDEQCDVETFKAIAAHVRAFANNALGVLAQHPLYAQSCLVNYDYAFRNILIDPQTYRVKALIDWDDMHVMPFVIGIDYPEDIQNVTDLGLAPDADYYREGEFPSFPPNEYGAIVGAVGPGGQLTPVDVVERDERIRNTMFRERYDKALEIRERRVAHPDMWTVRRAALKAHHLLMEGGEMWWCKIQWLSQQLEIDTYTLKGSNDGSNQ